MQSFNLPFQPIRGTLYSERELFEGFDAADPSSFQRTRDFRIYRQFIKAGGASSPDGFATMMQSLHDNSITQALRAFLSGQRCVGIMGGHLVPRDADPYSRVARLARLFTRSSLMVATGGGPGVMEAAHLGARLRSAPDAALDAALAQLRAEPSLPDLKSVVRRDGAVDGDLVEQAHRWVRPALEISLSAADPGRSLAVPTWVYGHEPATPLATHFAKYFQNSIREDGLLAIARAGVVFAEGTAGTIQEIFQDATQNVYKTFGYFSPMVFLGVDYWERRFPVRKILESLLDAAHFRRLLRFTDSIEEAHEFILGFEPPAGATGGVASLEGPDTPRRLDDP